MKPSSDVLTRDIHAVVCTVLKKAFQENYLFEPAERRQESILAQTEKTVLLWLAKRTPSKINPDHLTILGFLAQLSAGAGYAWSRWNKYSLLLVIVALALNWLGDSLDGTLARYRNQQRPRYGFYVDHMVDSFGALALMAGLAISGYMHPFIAIGLLVAFLLLSIQSYLATYTLGEFRLAFWKFGPTELRILLVIGNIVLFLRGPLAHIGRRVFLLFDVGGIIGIVGMTIMLIAVTVRNTHRLYNEERIR
jgi:archaetidylinositol phosphate synthase